MTIKLVAANIVVVKRIEMCIRDSTMDSVGETSGGCNPTYIGYKNIDGKLTVSTADLDTYADRFTSWGGPVK